MTSATTDSLLPVSPTLAIGIANVVLLLVLVLIAIRLALTVAFLTARFRVHQAVAGRGRDRSDERR